MTDDIFVFEDGREAGMGDGGGRGGGGGGIKGRNYKK